LRPLSANGLSHSASHHDCRPISQRHVVVFLSPPPFPPPLCPPPRGQCPSRPHSPHHPPSNRRTWQCYQRYKSHALLDFIMQHHCPLSSRSLLSRSPHRQTTWVVSDPRMCLPADLGLQPQGFPARHCSVCGIVNRNYPHSLRNMCCVTFHPPPTAFLLLCTHWAQGRPTRHHSAQP